MKRLFLSAFVFMGFLGSCDSDHDAQPQAQRVSSVEITIGMDAPITPIKSTYEFQYDAQGRVAQVNNRVFHYGPNGKVAYSRIHQTSPTPYGESEAIERLIYQWDAQGRLIEVYLDSLYTKTPTMPPGISVGDNETLLRHIRLAQYSYEGKNRKPATIVYLPYRALSHPLFSK